MRSRGVVALAFAVSVLGGCSGGGGSGASSAPPPQPPATPTTISGTAAANAPLSGIGVQVFARSPRLLPGTLGADVFSTTSANTGAYTVTTSASVQAPFLILTGGTVLPDQTHPQYRRLYSAAIRGGTTNVTPLTDLAIARILNRKLLFTGDVRAVFELQNLSQSQLDTARQQVVDYLMTHPSRDNGNVPAPVDVAAVTDFFSIPLTAAPGDPYFDALKRLHDSLMDSESIQGLEEHMLFGNDAPANPAAMLSLDFPAFCSVQGVDNGAMPKGNLPITLNPGGITFGSFVNLPFTSGDLLSITATNAGGQRWLFSSAAFSGTSVEFDVLEGRLFLVTVSILGTSSVCHATSELLLSDKAPSITALVRLFAQSINNPSSGTPATFQCSTPAVYFQDGTNHLVIENNGALRINAPNGPALHLLSFDIKVDAKLMVNAGQALIQPTRFEASRTLETGLDDLRVTFTNAGQITGLSLSRPQNGQGVQQDCGVI
jgi:hypothetical protein